MILGRDADFVVVAVGGGNPQAEQAVLSALRRTGLSIGLLPALRGLPVIGFRQHYTPTLREPERIACQSVRSGFC